MTARLQIATLWIGSIAVAAFGAASVAAYRPGGVTDGTIAFEELKKALAYLDLSELDSAARLSAYREGLIRADGQLRRAILSTPVDTGSIERLAAVRWESGVLAGNPNAAAIRSLVSIAAERAPRVPDIQADIGSLLYRMGNPDKAAPFMRRAVELSPTMTNRVVTLMQDAGVEPATIADTLPRTTELLTLLREGLARSGHLEEWLQNVEEALPEHPQELLWTYTDACLAAHTEDRLLANVRRLGVLSERTAEAERQIAIGRAQLAQHAWTLAASAAAIATTLAPTDARMLDHAGQTAFSAGDLITAEAAFRGALHALALEDRRTHDRARMYRQHGQVLERLGRVDEALDDYRRAAELVPDDSWLRERLTGTSPSSLVDGRQ